MVWDAANGNLSAWHCGQVFRFALIWLPGQALIEGSAADVRTLLAENVKDSELLDTALTYS
jgi:hypothetical protein